MIGCPVCLGSSARRLAMLPAMPLIGCRFARSREEALGAGLGTIELVLCKNCGHLYNRAFEPDRIAYTSDYENALHHSARFRAEAEAIVNRLIQAYDLRGKSIVEIGCGEAEFLSLVCARGGNNGVGYDPTQERRQVRVGAGFMTIVPQIFNGHGGLAADAVCALHVLEHLSSLEQTLRHARAALKTQGLAYFQVPNGLYVIRDLSVWDLTYEHFSYFLPSSFQWALEKAGFHVQHLAPRFGRQYLDAEARAACPAQPSSGMPASDEFCDSFPSALTEILGTWQQRLDELTARGCRIVLWGAGTKAVSFLNMLRCTADRGIEYVIDINPAKANRFVPGTAQQIMPPEFVREYAPDIVLVMNPEYLAEIRAMLGSLHVACDVTSVSSPAAR
jgi:SAM-dependent methyltransferase